MKSKEDEAKVSDTNSNVANITANLTTITIKKPKGFTLNTNKKKEEEETAKLSQQFNKVNESNISMDQSKTDVEIDNKNKKKVNCKFSLYDLQKLEHLGSGVSGDVFLIQHTATKKLLALKTVRYKNDEKIKTQIETEVRVSNDMKNDNIIRCYATYFNEGTINFVLEYMDKGTLADILKKVKKIPEHILGVITAQLIKGLAYIQKEKKIIHRDLKPSNILLNSKGFVKISDFGVSTIVEDSWAVKRSLAGTYIYMAPERIEADNYYLNSDIWSVGIVLLECALGYYPYLLYNSFKPIENVWMLHDLITNKQIPPLNDGEYSEEFVSFIKACLTREIKQRPTAQMLLNHPYFLMYENQPIGALAKWLAQIK